MQEVYLIVTCLSLCPVSLSLSLSLSKYDPLRGSCLQMAPTLQTFDAVKAQRLFSWHQQQKTLSLSPPPLLE